MVSTTQQVQVTAFEAQRIVTVSVAKHAAYELRQLLAPISVDERAMVRSITRGLGHHNFGREMAMELEKLPASSLLKLQRILPKHSRTPDHNFNALVRSIDRKLEYSYKRALVAVFNERTRPQNEAAASPAIQLGVLPDRRANDLVNALFAIEMDAGELRDMLLCTIKAYAHSPALERTFLRCFSEAYMTRAGERSGVRARYFGLCVDRKALTIAEAWFCARIDDLVLRNGDPRGLITKVLMS